MSSGGPQATILLQADDLKIIFLQARLLRNAREHTRANLVAVVES